MGYFFTLLYLVTAYITPPIIFGPLSEYHIEILVVFAAIITSIPKLPGSGLLRAPQSIALAGIGFAIIASIAQSGWWGGAVGPIYGFMQPAFAFILVAVNCKKRAHFSGIIAAFILCSIFFMVMGLHDLKMEVIPSEYLYGEGSLRRLRGLGFVHDPNDFAQVLVSLIPCVFLWRKRVVFFDLFLVGLPIVILVTGMYFTHSRGAMLATTAVVLFAARRRIGIVPAAVVAAMLIGFFFAIGWSGGRDVSMDAGSDRLDLWYEGMQSIKAHPLFGLGLGGFVETFGMTAHNSVMICAAELGLVGLFFWIMLISSSILTAVKFGSSKAASEGPSRDEKAPDINLRFDESNSPLEADYASPENGPFLGQPSRGEAYIDEEEAASQTLEAERTDISKILSVAVVGMLTAGWFISRALSMWLFMYFGMIYAASRMRVPQAQDLGPKVKLRPVLQITACGTAAAIGVMYAILRARNLGIH